MKNMKMCQWKYDQKEGKTGGPKGKTNEVGET